MFSYYGSKSQVVQLYPPPKYRKVIEPFAGSARYACLYYSHDVWINDKYDVVYRVWKWIQNATLADVMGLPHLEVGDDLRNMAWLSDIERLVLGFCVGKGRERPGHTATPRACYRLDQDVDEVRRLKSRLRKLVGRIDHWKITCLDYRRIGNQRATWFVDPPYQFGGSSYPHHELDYEELLRWVRLRRGQTIVCENDRNTWLDYSCFLKRFQGTHRTQHEVMRHECR